jgi:hypothetical protein
MIRAAKHLARLPFRQEVAGVAKYAPLKGAPARSAAPLLRERRRPFDRSRAFPKTLGNERVCFSLVKHVECIHLHDAFHPIAL